MTDIVFILPPDRNIAIGGYKVVYEYANRLSKRGWRVSIGYSCRNVGMTYKLPTLIRMMLVKLVSEYRRFIYPRWFKLTPKVKKFCIYNDNDVPKCDVMVATACGTASLVSKQTSYKKFYLIQGYETWGGRTEDEVKATYSLGLHNIVIAEWLKNIVDESCGKDNSILIPNGIDLQEFSLDIPPAERKVKRICMLYHKGEYKGSKFGIKALIMLKTIYPELQAVLFGVPPRPNALPRWIDYVQNASSLQLRHIYNDSQLYLYPAIEEGFGLTCVESMACGCALCSTDYRGVHEFAVDKENALLSPVRDVEAMVKNASLLLSDDSLRIKLAEKGHECVQMFDWEKSVDKLEKIFIQS